MPGANLVQSLLRGLDILGLAAAQTGGLRLHEVADRLGLKAPTAHNLLRTLVSRGFLQRNGGGAYHLGPALPELLQQHSDRQILSLGRQALQDLTARQPATYTLAERAGTDIAVRLRMSADRPGVVQEPRDMRFRLYTNASGLLYQAYADEETLTALRRTQPFAEYGAHLWPSLDDLGAYLATVRARGYVQLPGAKKDDRFCVAVPIIDARQELRAVLGMSHAQGRPLSQKKRQEAIRCLQGAATHIGQALA